jgi:hypothetical protein
LTRLQQPVIVKRRWGFTQKHALKHEAIPCITAMKANMFLCSL